MTYSQFITECKKLNISTADIKDMIEGYFKVSYNDIGIICDEQISSNAESIIEKLKHGYPPSYIAGYIDLLNLHILLNENVLIPRMETAYFIHDYIYEKCNLNNLKVLDLCTGSGFISLAIKNKFKDADVYASDISQNCIDIAKQNAKLNNLDITFIQSDYLKDIDDRFDCIISNPPYIKENDTTCKALFEPDIALYSGIDGLNSYREIFKDLLKHLTRGGQAYFEIEETQAENVIKLIKSVLKDQVTCKIYKDPYGKDRYLITNCK